MGVTGVFSLAVALVFASHRMNAQTPPTPAGIADLVRLAADNNRELTALSRRLPEARGILRQAGARPAPTLEFSGTTGRPLGTAGEEQYGASYNHIVETGGKRSRRIEAAEIGLQLAQAEFDERLRQITFDIAILYADATRQQRRLERLDRLIQLNQESIRLTEARVREGDAARLETQLLQVDVSRVEADRLSTAGQFEAVLIELKQLAGMDPTEALRLAPPTAMGIVADVSTLRERAMSTRPDLKLVRFLEQQGEAATRLAIAQGTPDVTLSGSYARVFSRFDDQFGFSPNGTPVQLRDRDDVLTLGVQIPIGTRNRNLGNVEAAAARAAGARLRRELVETRVASEIAAAVRRLDAAKSRLAVLDARVLAQSEKNLEVIRQAYQLGQFRLLDVLAEQRRVMETQLTYVDAQAEVAKATAEIERATGGSIQ